MRYLLVIGVLLFFISCSKEENAIQINDFRGKLIYNDQSVTGASVSLSNGADSYTTITSDQGEFLFSNIKSGIYSLKSSKNLADGSFVEKTAQINIQSDNQTMYLVLPNAVNLTVTAVNNSSVDLQWSSSDSENFREYKIYRGLNSALDEATGDLIHISTDKNSTTYKDSGMAELGGLSSNTAYFYRVYVMNAYGRLGGSNILEVVTTEFENEISTFYQINDITNFSGESSIGGIDFDGEFLWIVYYKIIGGYWDNNEVKLVKYNYQNGVILKTFEYNDNHIPPDGIAFEGSNIWIQYSSGSSSETSKLQKIDITNGEVIKTFSTEYGVKDISYFDGYIYLSYYRGFIEKIDPVNGALIEKFDNPFGSGAAFGIAKREDEIWLSERSSDKIAILNERGEHFAIGNNDFISSWNSGYYICFMNDQIILADSSRIYLCEIEN